MKNFEKHVFEARKKFFSKEYILAYEDYMELFNQNAKLWWLRMEALRSLSKIVKVQEKNKKSALIFSPNYTGNEYQSNMYSAFDEWSVSPSGEIGDEEVIRIINGSKSKVFHQHWVKEIYSGCETYEDGLNAIDKHISNLKALKSFGFKVLWSIHNLLDHDLTDIHKKICLHANFSMANVADIIHVHTKESIRLLEDQTGMSLEKKCEIVEHPIYDGILNKNSKAISWINSSAFKNRSVFLHMGMLRGYKGLEDILNALENEDNNFLYEKCAFIIAGHTSDMQLKQRLERLQEKNKGSVFVVTRRLSDEEMKYLLEISTIALNPYNNILISGSYYLSSTFGLPTLAKNVGMFKEMIDGIDGFLVNESESIVEAIDRVSNMSVNEIKKIGFAAKNKNINNTVKNQSNKLKAILVK